MTRRRLVELAVVLFGAAFLFYLATSFQPGRRPGTSTHRGEKIPAPPDGTEPGQPTTVLKGFDYTETVRGKPLFHIKSERTIGFGAAAGLLPNLYALEKVTLTVYPETGAPVTVNSEKATYDQRTNEAHLNGNVRWVDGRVALGETEELAFQPSARLLAARKPLRLTRGTFVLEARSGVYDVAKREARLEGPIHGSGTGEGTGGLTSFDAEHCVYHRDESTMELAGSVSALSAQGDRMQADQVVLKTGEEGQHLQWARAEGNVHGIIAASSLPQGAGGTAAGKARSAQTYHGDRGGLIFGTDGSMRSLSLSGNPATVEEPTRKLRASTIDVSFDQGHARSARAVGAVKIESEDSRGESNEATMELTPTGEMANLEMTGAVHMEGEGRSGRADKAVQVADRNVWILTAAPGRSATVEGDGSKVSASRIELDQKNRGLRAEGTARAVLTPRRDGQKLASPVGDGSKPTFGKAERITVDDASRVATLSGNATLWQDASSVFGNDITVNDRERTLVAVGNTRSVFTPAKADKPGVPTPAPPPAPPPTQRPTTGKSAGKSSAGATATDRHPTVITARRLIYREHEPEKESVTRGAASPSPSPALAPVPASSSIRAAGSESGPSVARFDDSVVVTSGEWRASSSQAVAWIAPDRKIDRVELTGDVVFQDSKEGRNGRAEHTIDWPRDGKTILEGKPAFVVDREGNRVAGATLTIFQRGGSVEVTAPEGGRTETIHKTRSQ